MKCKVSAQVMNDQNPPMWIPLLKQEPTEKQKEEAKKNTSLASELKMNKGYLICKSSLDEIEEFQVEQATLDTWKEGDPVKKVEEGGVTVI